MRMKACMLPKDGEAVCWHDYVMVILHKPVTWSWQCQIELLNIFNAGQLLVCSTRTGIGKIF